MQKILSLLLAILAVWSIPAAVTDYWPCAEFSVISECKYLQGACTDGTYIYQAFSHQVNSGQQGNYIFRMDAGSFRVKERVALTAGHMNDMTYNSRSGMIVSANSGGTGSKAYMLTWIDPDTLTVQSEKNIGRNVSTVAYDEGRDRYYVCTYDPSLLILDSDCNILSEIGLNFTGYTRQGMCYRNDILYFLLYGDSGNCIRCYTLDGRFLGDYPLRIPSGEPEGIFWLRGHFYVTYSAEGNKQGILYRLNRPILTQGSLPKRLAAKSGAAWPAMRR